MAKQNLLVVDADPRSLRVLEVSLRKAGYSVATAADAESALMMVELSPPDLILSDTRLPKMNGFDLVQRLRASDDSAEIPFMFLSSDGSLESKVRGLELGVEYLTKPIYIKEIITRVNLELQRKRREGLELKTKSGKTRFAGSLAEMGLVDLLQTIDISRKSGVLRISMGEQRGNVFFDEGRVIDAEVGSLTGDAAIYRLLVWSDGNFEIDFRVLDRPPTIKSTTQALLMEGMRRLDEWGRMLEQLPPLDSVFEVQGEEFVDRLAEIPDEINSILKHFDGYRSLLGVVDATAGDDLTVLSAISKLYFEGLITDTGRRTAPFALSLANEATSEPPEEQLRGDDDHRDGRPRDDQTGDGPLVVVPGDDDSPPPGPIPTGPTPDADRANPNAEMTLRARTVPDRAEAATAEAPETGESAPGEPGTDPASESDSKAAEGERPTAVADRPAASAENGDSAPAGADEAYSEPNGRSELDDDSGPRAGEAPDGGEDRGAALVDQDPATDPQAEEDEMAKKRKRKKNKAAAAAVAETNVIQFPAKEQVAVARAAGGDAVRQGTVSGGEGEYEPRPAKVGESHRAPAGPRDDDTGARVRLETDPSAESIAEEAMEKALVDGAGAGRQTDEAVTESRRDQDRDAGEAPSTPDVVDAGASPKGVAESSVESPKRRKKKAKTTSSQMIKALSDTGEHAAVTETFFKADSYEATRDEDHQETWDDLQPVHAVLSLGEKRARRIAVGIFLVSLLLGGAYWLYQNVWMPAPENVGAASLPQELPTFSLEQQQAMARAAQQATADEAANDEAANDEAANDEAATDEASAPGTEGDLAGADPDQDPTTDTEPLPLNGEGAVAGEGDVAAEVDPPPAPTGAYATLLEEAEGLERRGRRRQAEEKYREAIAANPEGSGALANLAFMLLNRGRSQEAADLAGRATAVDATSSKGWITLGAARQNLRDAAGAREAYGRCVEVGQGPFVNDCRLMMR